MINNESIDKFIQKVKLESAYHKFLEDEIIYKLINIFNNKYAKKQYSRQISKPLDLVLSFYQNYSTEYYGLIIDGLNDGKIVFTNSDKSIMDVKNNIAFINLTKNDSDIYRIVHEFAHFIDRNSDPIIIPNQYNFFCEVFSFYMERKFELWLRQKDSKYDELIEIRRNNRLYYEEKMLKAIEYELYYESLYKKKGNLEESDISEEAMKIILSYDIDYGFISYLLRYPLANILTKFIIDNNLIESDSDICEVCLNTNLQNVIKKAEIDKILCK